VITIKTANFQHRFSRDYKTLLMHFCHTQLTLCAPIGMKWGA